ILKIHLVLNFNLIADNWEVYWKKIKTFLQKDFTITVDGVTYPLAVRHSSPTLLDDQGNFFLSLSSDYAEKIDGTLYTVMKQRGQTKRFELSWK
ncbi:hypothetical protein ID858_14165, partial [Xenorhabdus sp. DI]|uniref:DUF7823 domain-containing protein n=1 Tax=Xenorhabdus doucetiae TaxID=351671 RepID=UPI00199DB40E